MNSQKRFQKTLEYLKKKKKILFLTTSNRWQGDKEKPKSTLLAYKLKEKLKNKVTILEIPKLKIYNCEGNVSTAHGNTCGLKGAVLKNKNKNPSGNHRCWASINNKDDELWKVSKEIFNSDCIIFFTSVRWGQTNAYYQKLIERLTWIENRQSTLQEDNPVKNIEAGIIIIGQNWNGKNILKAQKTVLNAYGFRVKKQLCWNWQYTKDYYDESQASYKDSFKKFTKLFVLR